MKSCLSVASGLSATNLGLVVVAYSPTILAWKTCSTRKSLLETTVGSVMGEWGFLTKHGQVLLCIACDSVFDCVASPQCTALASEARIRMLATRRRLNSTGNLDHLGSRITGACPLRVHFLSRLFATRRSCAAILRSISANRRSSTRRSNCAKRSARSRSMKMCYQPYRRYATRLTQT